MESGIALKVTNFFRQHKLRKYDKGEVIISPDWNPEGLFFLEQGVVRQYAISPQGIDMTINTFKSPAFMPVGWLLNGTPIRHYYETTNAVRAWVAPKEEARHFLKTNHDVVLDLLGRIYKGMEGYFLRMESLMSGTARSRLVAQLIIHASRFGKNGLKVTESDLASQAGISRETVSRQIQILIKEGIVKFEKGRLEIVKPDALAAEMLLN